MEPGDEAISGLCQSRGGQTWLTFVINFNETLVHAHLNGGQEDITHIPQRK